MIVSEYVDRVKTGTNDNRPAFQQMLYGSKNKSFNSDDKGTQLKLSEQPDFEQETEFLAKKEQPEHKCSDCYHLAGLIPTIAS